MREVMILRNCLMAFLHTGISKSSFLIKDTHQLIKGGKIPRRILSGQLRAQSKRTSTNDISLPKLGLC